MAYITKETMKAKRDELKKTFPNLKLSVTCRDHSQITIKIMESDINFLSDGNTSGYESVNHFYIEELYKDEPEKMKILLKIAEIAQRGQREVVYDMDYGSIPNYYISIGIGKWDRPFKFTGKTQLV
jgi:hypothetical protein